MPTYDSAMIQAFRDEVTKIAGEMQGYTRIGRKPISIEKMLDNESAITGLPDDFVKLSMKGAAKAVGLMGIGAMGGLAGRQAYKDHRTGRMVRKQQQAQMKMQGY
jgi:hypothetical protein